MADETQPNSPIVLRSINWREVFPFTHIFRGFRIAVHPSKLVLGLVALLTLYVGGRLLDGIWPLGSLANPNEIASYERHLAAASRQGDRAEAAWRAAGLELPDDFPDELSVPAGDYADQIGRSRASLESSYAALLRRYDILPDVAASDEAAKDFARVDELKSRIMWVRNDTVEKARAAHEADRKAADQLAADQRTTALESADAKFARTVTAANAAAARAIAEEVDALLPRGIFREFFDYQVAQVNGVATAVAENRWVAPRGVVERVKNFFAVGPVWLWKYHTVYAVLFTLLFLLVWAVFGGAISRIAAVHVARDEKISVRQALRFSLNKVLSFIFAPVIPLIIIAVIGLLIAIGGLLLYIPWGIGPIIVGAMFFLALIASVVITLVLFGTIGGFSLMYPTIAVEGSDSFDAISRSFSYVFARPWRMLFYTILAIAYGALTYLFVRFFVWIVLLVTHFFASLFLVRRVEGGTGYWFNQMWPGPGAFWDMSLPHNVNFAGLHTMESIAAFLISLWVYLLIGLVGAYAISYFLSVSTIIYTLMRREVDATELEDVYVEELEDDLGDIAPVTPVTATTTTPPATTQDMTAELPPSDNAGA